MEFYFLILLVAILIFALTSGFPVAFALPGSAVITIALAAFFGWIIEGNPDAYFHLGGPNQWLSAGVTNYRSLYWEVERDTLIAIPLFVFMGIMLQRSKIAEDLLVAMAQLFGPIPGGLGISVVFVVAASSAPTKTTEIPRPPGMGPNSCAIATRRSSAIFERCNMMPMNTNSGIAISVSLSTSQ